MGVMENGCLPLRWARKQENLHRDPRYEDNVLVRSLLHLLIIYPKKM
jgi:hypothetical protein